MMWYQLPKEDAVNFFSLTGRRLYKSAAICLLLCILLAMRATAFPLQQYTTANGLINNNVYHSFADSRGYLWIATDKGIARFDGKNFVNITTLDGLADNTNFNFFEDKEHCVWPFAYNSHYCRIRNTTAERIPFSSLPGGSYINAMCYDDAGALYIGYYNGDVFKIAAGKVQPFYLHNSRDRYVHSLAWENGILKVYSNPVWRYFKNGRLIREHYVGDNSNFYYNDQLFVADTAGIKVYHQDSLIYQYKDADLNFAKIIHLYGDTSGNIFCSTSNGLILLNRNDGRKQHLLAGHLVYCCMQDQSGDYWISSYNKGIWRINKAFGAIGQVNKSAIKKVFYNADGCFFAISNDHVNIPVITDTGLYLKQLPFRLHNTDEPVYCDSSLFICNSRVYNGLVARFCNIRTGKTDTLKPYCKRIVHLGGHRFLVSTHESLYGAYYDGNKVHKEADYAIHNRNLNICAASQGGAWVLKNDTLYHCDRRFRLRYFARLSGLNNANNIYCYYGKLFVLSQTAGIRIYAEQNGKAIEGHLPFEHDVVYDIARLPDSALLFYTPRGEYLLTQKHGQYNFQPLQYPFGPHDYDELYPYSDYCFVYLQENLYGFRSGLLNRETVTPSIFINGLEINGKNYDPDKPIHIKNTTECNINIQAATLYFHGYKNTIQYRVTGDETGSWQTIEGNAIHIQLNESGHHYIQLRALYENHYPVSQIDTIALLLSPPYYRSNWFNALILLLLTILTGIGIELYIRKRKKVMLSELNYLKIEHKSINSLLNPHFVFNAINNIQSLINSGTREKANDYLATMSTLIRQNIENLQFHFIELANELELVQHYISLQNLRFDNKIVLEINDENQLASHIAVPPLLIHTFVENAIVHGFRDKTKLFRIEINIGVYDDQYVLFHITDNGVGLQQPSVPDTLKHKTSMGIDFNRKRLERINSFYKLKQSITVADRSAKGEDGTEVIIILYRFLQMLIEN